MTTAIVVGGGSGIGEAVVQRQRALGINVLVWDRTEKADICCDISDPDQVDAAASATLTKVGVPNLVTITAGIGHGAMLIDVPHTEWDKVMNINTKGVWLVMRAMAKAMLQNGGSIVATSSVSAYLADRSMGLYCASKAALDMIIRVAAQEWAPSIRVNGVAPGVTDTPMLGRAPRDAGWLQGVSDRTALKRLGSSHDVAEAIIAIHGMQWMTGQIVPCDGGLSLYSPIDPLKPQP